MTTTERGDTTATADLTPPQPRPRSKRPLVTAWVTALVIELVIFGLTVRTPAITVLMRPLMVIVVAAAMVATWRWVRPRHESDRRGGDRRHLFRRARRSRGEDNSGAS
jgi:hypothetical protein